MSKPVNALVLSGGGSRGAYQAGACMGLLERGFSPDIVCGTSVGAINGALVASGAPPEDLGRIWRAIGSRNLAPRRRDLWRWRSWESWSQGAGLARIIRGHIDVGRIRSGPTRFLVTALSTCCGELRTFDNDEITADHILASAAFPGIFPPVHIGHHWYVDGGVSQNTPLRPAIAAGATDIVAVLTDSLDHCVPGPPGNVLGTLFRISDLQSHAALLQEAHRVDETNELLRSGVRLPGKHFVRLRFVAPEAPLEGDLFKVDQERTARWLRQGRQDAMVLDPTA